MLTSALNPSLFGQGVTFTAEVTALTRGTGTPTGTVTFRDALTVLGTGTVNASGQATFQTAALATGTHTLSAAYGGDATFSASTSAFLTQNVNRAATSVTLASATNPSVSGQNVTFTATVSPLAPGAGRPTGTVTFRDGGLVLGTVTLDTNGQATFQTTALALGSRSLSAAYGGDANFTASNSTALSQTVGPVATSVTLTSAANPSVFEQVVRFTATVTATAPGSGTPTGVVTFRDGTTVLGIGLLDASGRATLQTGALSIGTHAVTATFDGSPSFSSGSSAVLAQAVLAVGQPTTTAVDSSLPASVFGQSVTFTATVSALPPVRSTPTGTVTFRDGTTVLGTGTLNASVQATFQATALRTGTHVVTAAYDGNATFSASTSTFLIQIVNRAATRTTLTSSANPSVSGQTVTFTVTVSAVAPGAGIPSGLVTGQDGSLILASGPLNASGQVTFQTSALAVGTHPLSVVYSGDANFTASTSAILNQVVNRSAAAAGAIATLLTSTSGQAVTLTPAGGDSALGTGIPTGAARELALDFIEERQSMPPALALPSAGSEASRLVLERVWTGWEETWLDETLLADLTVEGLA